MNRSIPVTRAILLAGWMVLMFACTPSSEGAALESKEIVPKIIFDGVTLLDSVSVSQVGTNTNNIIPILAMDIFGPSPLIITPSVPNLHDRQVSRVFRQLDY